MIEVYDVTREIRESFDKETGSWSIYTQSRQRLVKIRFAQEIRRRFV